jgi:hypothetical protein
MVVCEGFGKIYKYILHNLPVSQLALSSIRNPDSPCGRTSGAILFSKESRFARGMRDKMTRSRHVDYRDGRNIKSGERHGMSHRRNGKLA